MNWKRFIFAVSAIIFMNAAHALTRIVDIEGSGQYTSIQTAVSASSPGDTVLVYPGRYLENVSIISNNISLISLEATTGNPAYIDSTIIDGRAVSWGIWVRQNSQNITIRGFTITNCRVGLAISDSSANVTNCNIFGNTGLNGAGFGVSFGTVQLSGVNIFDNCAYNMGGGMYIYGYMGVVSVTFDPVNRCSIYNNMAGAGQDIVAHSINNDLDIPLQKFTVANPTSFYAAPYRALGNEFQLNINSLEAHHQEINSDLYVSPNGDDSNDGLSSATPLRTIRTAVYRVASDSLNQKTVHILPGTYSRTANQQVFPIPLKSWVKVQGAGIDSTQIVGEMDPAFANVSYNPLKVFASCYQTHPSLSELSITSQDYNNSCAVWGYDEAEMQLSKLRFHDLCPNDYAVLDICYNRSCLWNEILVEDISTPLVGLIYSPGYFSGTIRNSVFKNAVSTYYSSEVWAPPLIWMTAGSFLFVENTVFENITMMDNDSQAFAIGGVSNPVYIPHYRFQNSMFSNIQCNLRGMLLLGYNDPVMEIVNCTFAGQTGDGPALMVNGNATITNCVFYNDRPYEIAINPMDNSGIVSTLSLDNNLIKGGFNSIQQAPGNTINYSDTNITGNPLFLGGDDIHDPLYYSLSAGSPCINAGTPDVSGLELLPYDLAGNWRIWDGRIDMGCFEYGSEPWVSADDPVIPQPEEITLYQNYPNPFNPATTISYQLPESGKVRLEIYNLKGQLVKTLVDGTQVSGLHSIVWNGTDSQNRKVASGVYLYRLSSLNNVQTKRMLLMK
jgi:hypothetical protein